MTPKISVCVPTYNGARYVSECLDDILAQTFGEFEVLVVDDASTDDTLDIVNLYAANDKRIRVRRNAENLGLVANWNRCLTLAEGEWIKFVFQDDRIHSECLETLLGRSRADVPLVVGQRNFRYENISAKAQADYERFLQDTSLISLFPEAGFVSPYRFCRAALARPGVNFIGEPTAVMLHRSARERFGCFNPDFVQLCDFEYWVRIACNTGLIVVSETLASFRIHPQSKSAANHEQREFRTEIVDPLLLKYEFAYGACFAPLRSVAKQQGINLKRSLSVSAKRVEFQVRRRAKDVLLPDTETLAEWKSVIAAYPKLTESLHSVVYRFSRELDRHLLWRFRKDVVRFKKPASRCPIILCMDVEPDTLSKEFTRPMSWKGFEIASELFSTVRPLLAATTGTPIHYTWMLRIDRQIAEVYDSPSWLMQHYEAKIRQYSLEGDEIGIVARAQRWDAAHQAWVPDLCHNGCLEGEIADSFAAFRALLGRNCDSFRLGEGSLSDGLIRQLQKLKARFDLSLQRGKFPASLAQDGGPHMASPYLPMMPYRPADENFMIPDPLRTEGLWIIPLSVAMHSEVLSDETTLRPKPFNLESPPEEFEWLVNKVVCEMDHPYLALTVCSSIGVNPKLLRNVKMNFSTLLMHPLADRFVFSTPAEALEILG